MISVSCGYVGDPKPPALRLPMKVTDLAAVERGPKILVTFTLPVETTDGLLIETPPDVELRIGPTPREWNEEEWAKGADRVPVPAWQPVPKAPKSILPRKAAPAASGASGAKRPPVKTPPKRNAPLVSPEVQAGYFRTVEVDAAKYSGKTVAVGLKTHGPHGRDDGWSVVSLEVLPPLNAPRELKATDGPGTVHLQWLADAPMYRVFRRVQSGTGDDTNWTQLGESATLSFDDKTFEYGKTWQYYVQSVRKAGDHWIESNPSETFTFRPQDRFPPAVPTGLLTIAGTNTIELTWDHGTDTDLASYRVYRDSLKIADAVTTTAYSDKDVKAGVKYRYQVSAVDQSGNESEKSAPQEMTME
jgi:hypothetical protein